LEIAQANDERELNETESISLGILSNLSAFLQEQSSC